MSEQLSAVYERIELSTVKPIVTRVERYVYRCRQCELESKAPVPAGLGGRKSFCCLGSSSARVICSDETGVRVNGQNQWEWVFQNEQVCFHVIRPSRGKQVIEQVMEGHRPSIWVSDLFSSQKANPAEQWQVCLAHQLRDCQYAIDCGDDLIAVSSPLRYFLSLEIEMLFRLCDRA